MIWVHTVCHKGFLNISADEKSRRLVKIGALKVKSLQDEIRGKNSTDAPVASILKAAYSVTFDLLILELMFLFFKNTVKKLKFRYTFYQFRKS